jgi:transposase
VFVDLDRSTRPVIFATPGKGRECVKAFKAHLKRHGGHPDNVLEVVCDMSPAFLSAVEKEFKKAQVTVDWFHVVKLFTQALEKVRRNEQKQDGFPKSVRWAILKGQEKKKTARQLETLQELENSGFATATAYRIKELLRWIRHATTSQTARWRITHFIRHAEEHVQGDPCFKPVQRALNTFKELAGKIARRWWVSNHTNARLEGLNSLFQSAKAKARVYRNERTFIAMRYLIGAPIEKLLKEAAEI